MLCLARDSPLCVIAVGFTVTRSWMSLQWEYENDRRPWDARWGPNKSCSSLLHYCFRFGTCPFLPVMPAGNPQNNSSEKKVTSNTTNWTPCDILLIYLCYRWLEYSWHCATRSWFYLLFSSIISSSSLYHLMVESLSTLKNWHHIFRCPDASGNGSPLILRMTCGAGGAWQRGCQGKYILAKFDQNPPCCF